MNYYLPININRRRIHTLCLEKKTIDEINPTYSFIVSCNGATRILSIDSETPTLASDAGFKNNVNLSKSHTVCISKIELQHGLPAYNVNICPMGKAIEVDKNCPLKSTGHFGIPDKPVHVDLDTTMEYEPQFVLVVSYTNEDGESFNSAIKIHTYANDKTEEKLVTAAVDFGSEASQIRVSGRQANVPIINDLLFYSSVPERPGEEYWQGRSGDKFYKSVFFINKRPNTTTFADKPKVKDNNAFIWPLIKTDESATTYEKLLLVPNLKLVEMCPSAMDWPIDQRVRFDDHSDIGDGNELGLDDENLRGPVLRMILSNFLHVILKETCSGRNDKYLRVMLMVPNVYYQSKVSKIMTEFYDDFNIIKNSGDYPNCKGFEVQIVSESDAAFFGVRQTCHQMIHDKADAYFIIIDAGKGTTDFSILQQNKVLSSFTSLHRDGMPASGNVLTYAVYEALCEWFNTNKIPINDFIKNADNAEKLRFVQNLENYKAKFDRYDEDLDLDFTIKGVNNLNKVNVFLQNNFEGHRIPGSMKKVNEKTDLLVKKLEESLTSYMDSKNIRFEQALLTGRAFKLKLFSDKVIQMLLRHGWINSTEDILSFREGDLSKTICLDGALVVDTQCSVNCNSGLVGSPTISSADNSVSFKSNKTFSKFLKPLINMFSDGNGNAREFILDGSETYNCINLKVKICGREYTLPANQQSSVAKERKLFFTGDGFICQTEEEVELIKEQNYQNTDPELDLLTVQSLFPHHSKSILRDNGVFTSTQDDNDEETDHVVPTGDGIDD